MPEIQVKVIVQDEVFHQEDNRHEYAAEDQRRYYDCRCYQIHETETDGIRSQANHIEQWPVRW